MFKLRFILVATYFFIFFPSAFGESHFSSETGELHWEFENVKIEYLPECRMTSFYNVWDSEDKWIVENNIIWLLYDFIEVVDFYGILNVSDEPRPLYTYCKDEFRGIKVTNTNHSKGEFESLGFNEVVINDKAIYYYNDSYPYKGYNRNYEPIYEAIQTNSPVKVSIRAETYIWQQPIKHLGDMDISDIAKSDLRTKKLIDEQVAEANSFLLKLYPMIVLASLLTMGVFYFFITKVRVKAISLCKISLRILIGYLMILAAASKKLLHLFFNTFRKIGQKSISDELLKLHGLLESGIITKEEFLKLKSNLLKKY